MKSDKQIYGLPYGGKLRRVLTLVKDHAQSPTFFIFYVSLKFNYKATW